MADQTVVVRLRADVAAYKAALIDARRAGADMTLATDRNLRQLGGTLEEFGGTMTRRVTLPLTLAGGAAWKMGADFDQVFAQMVGLAGVAADEVDGLKQAVLDLAEETAVAPQELANALYFAASAGLDTAAAMEAVEHAARASAAGMGQAEDVVGLAASAIASYGAANIDAARATDILVGTIRAGRADPDELAGTLGRILPVAAQLGVEFEEVGGAVAYLSNNFGDTNRTVTALSGFLVKLVSPTQQGRDALTQMGTSVEELHEAIDQRGLLGALDLLREKGFANNQQALRALFDDIEGFQAALALLNDRSGQLTGVMAEVAGSTGALGEAFDAAQTDGFRVRQALVEIQTALIQAGDVIAPFAAAVAGVIGDLASGFGGLPDPIQLTVLSLLAVGAAIGPLTSLAGMLITNWGRLAAGARVLSSAMVTMRLRSMYAAQALGTAGIAGAAGLAMIAVAGLTYAWMQNAQEAREAEERVRGWEDAIRDAGNVADGYEAHLAGMVREHADFARLLDMSGTSVDDLADAMRGSDAEWEAFRDAMLDAAAAAGMSDRDVNRFGAGLGRVRDEAAEAAGNVDTANRVLDETAPVAEEAAEGVDTFADASADAAQAQRDLFAAMDAVLDLALGGRDALSDWEASLDDLAESAAENGATLDLTTEAGRRNHRILTDLIRAGKDRIQSLIEQGASERDVAAAQDLMVLQLQNTLEQLGFNKDEAYFYAMTLANIPTSVNTTVRADVDAAIANIQRYIDKLSEGAQYRGPGGGPAFSARGGTLTRGQRSVVGDGGPEVVEVGSDGTVTIHPNNSPLTQSAIGGWGGTFGTHALATAGVAHSAGGGSTVQHFDYSTTIHASGNTERQLARAVRDANAEARRDGMDGL